MNTNPVGNSKPAIHEGKSAKANQILKLATCSTKAAALLLALNYFPTVAEAGTKPPTDGVPSQADKGLVKLHVVIKRELTTSLHLEN